MFKFLVVPPDGPDKTPPTGIAHQQIPLWFYANFQKSVTCAFLDSKWKRKFTKHLWTRWVRLENFL